MRKNIILGALALAALVFVGDDATLFARGGGGRGGGAGGGARGGAVSASRSSGAVVGPYGGSGAGTRSSQTIVGPSGGSRTAGSGQGSYTTGGGSTINYGGAGVKGTGPGGVSAGKGVGGVQVTTPGGQTYTKVGSAGGIQGPGGNAVGGSRSIGTTTGPNGAGASISRKGAAIGPGGAVAGGSRVGAVTGPGGGTAVGGTRWGAAAGPYGMAGYAARGVAVGHRTNFVGPSQLPARGANIRQNFIHYNCFHPTWWTSHPNAWRAAAWGTAAVVWTGAAWRSVASSCGYPAEPVVYDYGTTIVYEGDQVYVNGDPVATAEEYTQQATQLADQGQQAKADEKDEWIPLGVFGMVQGEEKDANNIFQLAINKDGIIRGNYYNALTDTTVPVYGSVDKTTQRAAWIAGEQKDTVYETGIGNLTQPETSMLVHFGKDRTQQWTLVRLDKPEDQK